MMRKIIFALIILSITSTCYADIIKGPIEKVDIKAYEIIVDGKRVSVSTAMVFTVNDLGVVRTIIIRDLKDHRGETAVCYGSPGKEDVFIAYKVKVSEGHR